jgi:glycerophosphoryl diester phosphodiesterase
MRRPLIITAAVTALVIAAPAAAQAHDRRQAPTLEGRAILPDAATAPAPFGAVPNADPAPAAGATQPIGGFSALLDAGHGTYWAMPDNGFGSKANSRSFILRVYRVRPHFRTERGGSGAVDVLEAVSLRDPDHRIPFPIVNGATPERILTGGDFDIESVRIAPDGTFWFGEELGPFLVHADRTGRVLEAPIPTPGVQSPDSPYLNGGTPNLNRSSGFEGMALSADGRKLYPVLEGAVKGDDPRARRVYEFDVRTRRFTGRTWTWQMTSPELSVSDFTALGEDRFVVLERDNGQGAAAAWKRAFVTDLQAPAGSVLPRRQVADLLAIADPAGISAFGARPGDIGIGDPFSFPYQTVEAVLPQRGERLAIVNDTNFGSTGRNPARPDDSDFIVVRVPGLRDSGQQGEH